MSTLLISLFSIILLLLSLFLVLIILMQRANTNAGLGTAFGGGLTESAFGAQAGNVLTRATIVACSAFFVTSFGLYLAYLNLKNPNDEVPVLPDPASLSAETIPSESPALPNPLLETKTVVSAEPLAEEPSSAEVNQTEDAILLEGTDELEGPAKETIISEESFGAEIDDEPSRP